MSVPIGTILAYGAKVDGSAKGQLEREGWLICDGEEAVNAEYPDLADKISGLYGLAGPGHFKLPDLRGRFVRGVDETGEVDPDYKDRFIYNGDMKKPVEAQVGSLQEDELKEHEHYWRGWNSIPGPGAGAHVRSHKWIEKDKLEKCAAKTGGKETRPKNIYVNWIIKAKNVAES